jgi:hypothetical protein
MSTEVLGEEDIHRVAWLTMRGWTCLGHSWTKLGFKQRSQRSRPCGCCTEDVETEVFNRDEAYWAQQEAEP